jgi:predicted regulator of Ras-like GTPase activity (Roadblock/LC7/MglB family)
VYSSLPPVKVKGYAPPMLRRSVEPLLLRDIAAQSGVTGAALLDGDGFVLYSQPPHDDSVQNLGKAIALLDPNFSSGRVTLNGENGTVIVQELSGNRVLVVRCLASSNLGQLRHILDEAVVRFNTLIP